jgi:hypothetical protein
MFLQPFLSKLSKQPKEFNKKTNRIRLNIRWRNDETNSNILMSSISCILKVVIALSGDDVNSLH